MTTELGFWIPDIFRCDYLCTKNSGMALLWLFLLLLTNLIYRPNRGTKFVVKFLVKIRLRMVLLELFGVEDGRLGKDDFVAWVKIGKLPGAFRVDLMVGDVALVGKVSFGIAGHEVR